jgi:hypothetical protein
MIDPSLAFSRNTVQESAEEGDNTNKHATATKIIIIFCIVCSFRLTYKNSVSDSVCVSNQKNAWSILFDNPHPEIRNGWSPNSLPARSRFGEGRRTHHSELSKTVSVSAIKKSHGAERIASTAFCLLFFSELRTHDSELSSPASNIAFRYSSFNFSLGNPWSMKSQGKISSRSLLR